MLCYANEVFPNSYLDRAKALWCYLIITSILFRYSLYLTYYMILFSLSSSGGLSIDRLKSVALKLISFIFPFY